MTSVRAPRTYRAKATPQHNGKGGCGYEPRPDDALILGEAPALGLGDRCRWYRGIMPKSEAAANENPLVWHAAVTNPGRERDVQRQMQERGIDTVMPMVRFWRIRNRVRLIAERPLIARCVLFGYDPDTQALVEPEVRYDYIGGALVPRADDPGRVRPISGLERVVRGASDRWAVLPTDQVYDLRLSILRGDYDATLREGKGNVTRDLPPIIKWLLAQGELKKEAILTHRQARIMGLQFSEAA